MYLSVLVLQLQLSADVELVFARGTVTPEQQKKLPLTQTQEKEHVVNGDVTRTFTTLRFENERPVCSFFDFLFPEDTTLRYRYEMRYRTATIMEEDALNKPTPAGEPALISFTFSVRPEEVMPLCSCFVEADLSLHTLSESPCGSLVLYVIPESSSLLHEVKTPFCMCKC